MAAAILILFTAAAVTILMRAAARADRRHLHACCHVCAGLGAVTLTDIRPGTPLCAAHTGTARRIADLEADLFA